MYDTNLVLGGKEFTSRLIVGTGKYSTLRRSCARRTRRRAPRSSPWRCGG